MNKKQNRQYQLIACPICKDKAVVKKGYKDAYYVKCTNNCCVTRYFESKEQAIKSWNNNEMNLTWQEKMRVGSDRPELIRRKK